MRTRDSRPRPPAGLQVLFGTAFLAMLAARPAAEPLKAARPLDRVPAGIPQVALLAAVAEPGKPRRIEATVSAPRGGYIGLKADYCIEIRAPFTVVWTILNDFSSYPEVFETIDQVWDLSRGPSGWTYRQRSVVRAAGLEFPSECVMAAEALQEGPGRGRIGFASLEDDGSVRDIGGGWYVESRDSGDGAACIVRYVLESSSQAKFPFQDRIIALSMDAAIGSALKGLERRASTLSRSASEEAAEAPRLEPGRGL